jgi:signal transduction histidine kinase
VQANDLNIELHTEFTETFLTHVSNASMAFDKSKITLVINNLLSNALKFTSKCPERQVTVEVDYVMDVEDNGNGPASVAQGGITSARARPSVGVHPCFLKICVTDTGVGIAPVI